jgi:membrane associated rhomboid family serine protease
VLRAKGIPCVHARDAHGHGLFVTPGLAEAALRELASYEEENRSFRPRPPLPPAMPGAGQSTAVALAILLTVWAFDGQRAFGLSWSSLGVADARAVRAGEVWRALTALTLHDGPVHLASNLLWLGFLGFLVALAHGPGLGWLAILAAGALGNLANAWIQDPTHLSLGASTAVFAAIGIAAGSEWRRRFLLRQRRILLWAPILIAAWFLGSFGLGGGDASSLLERVDVLAHVLGLIAGLAIGPLLPFLADHGARDRASQRAAGAAALALVVLGWALALLRS